MSQPQPQQHHRLKPRRRGKPDRLNIVLYSDSIPPNIESAYCTSSSATNNSNENASSSNSNSSSHAGNSNSRLLFVEVRGPQGKRRRTLLYDRSARELKSHVMLVTNEDKRQRRRRRRRRRIAGDGSVVEEEEEEVEFEDAGDPGALIEVALSHVPRRSGIISDIGQRYVDPFDALPVQGTPELHAAMRYYFENYPGVTPLTDDTLVCHSNTYQRERVQWSQVQFSFCQGLRASYYVILFAWQLMKDLAAERKDMSFLTRTYWSWVLQTVREDMPIGKTGLDIPESYIGVVGGLAAAQTWCGDWDESRRHIRAVLALVAARGGLDTFCPIARRSLKWVEYHPCAALLLAPALPPLPQRRPLPADLAGMARAAHARSMAWLPPRFAGSPLDAVVRQLHEASVGLSAGCPQALVAGVVDDVEHALLEELARWMKDRAPATAADAGVELVYGAVLNAAQTYVWGAFTALKKEAALYALFVARLREALEVPRLLETWAAATPVEVLLWVLFVGWTVASQQSGDVAGAIPAAMWFMERTFEVMEALRVRDKDELCVVLQYFPWRDQFFREPCTMLWNAFSTRETLQIRQKW